MDIQIKLLYVFFFLFVFAMIVECIDTLMFCKDLMTDPAFCMYILLIMLNVIAQLSLFQDKNLQKQPKYCNVMNFGVQKLLAF